MEKIKYNIPFYFLIFLILVGAGSELIPQLRLAKYTLAPLVIIYGMLFSSKIRWDNKFLKRDFLLSFLIVFFGVFFAIIYDNCNMRAFSESYFMLSPIIIVFFLNRESVLSDKNITILLMVFSVLYLVDVKDVLYVVITNPSVFLQGVVSSTIETESTHAFVFGLFFIYFLIHQKPKRLIVTSVLLILAYKRIAIVACGVVYILYYLDRMLNIKFKTIKKLLWFGVFFGAILLLILTLGIFDEIIFEITGKSTNQFLMGRQQLYSVALDKFPLIKSSVGNGLGSISTYFSELNQEEDSIIGVNLLLHSDLLKIIIEIGTIGYLFWAYFKVKFNVFSKSSAYFFIYMLFLLFTDNVLIYFNVLVVYYMFQAKLYNEKLTEN